MRKISHFLTIFGLIISPVLLYGANAFATAKGGSAQSYSTLFFAAARGPADAAASEYARIYAESYGEGPIEPSLASTIDGSLLKQSSPLTIASADNSRREIAKYIVKPGNTPSAIAAAFGITTNTLLWANNLSEWQYIQPGDKLTILPVSGVLYKVRSGDTISGIAAKFKGETAKIAAFNDLGPDGNILEGEDLIIPDGEMPKSYGSSKYTAKYAPYTQNLDDSFIHPTAGIGYKSRGLHDHNAVDIAASCWTPIYAATDGTVVLADGVGWNGGYGKYVKVSHENGASTVYAHNIQNAVSAGQNVQQGELIAYMGSTGRSTGCHVHWEVYGALNPLR